MQLMPKLPRTNRAFGRTPYPEFSWSHSRDRVLNECERRYYWQYYGSHNGWERTANTVTRAAYRLKQLTTFPQALGTAVHRAAREIALAIRDGRARPTYATLLANARADLNALYVRSRAHRGDRQPFLADPKRHAVTVDAYYGRTPRASDLLRLREKLQRCLDLLVTCPVWSELAAPGTIVQVADELAVIVLGERALGLGDEDPKGTREQGLGDLRDVPIYVAPDLAFRPVAGSWVVLDWKTGSINGASEQLALYALALQEELGPKMCPSPIDGRVVGLDAGTCHTVNVSGADVAAARARVGASVARMRLKLVDPARNVALPPAAFPLATDRRNCPRCPFYELCRHEL